MFPRPPDICPEGQIQCKNIDKCIWIEYQCDGFIDCIDNDASSEFDNSQSVEDDMSQSIEDIYDIPSDEGKHCKDEIEENCPTSEPTPPPQQQPEVVSIVPETNQRRRVGHMRTSSLHRKTAVNAKYSNDQLLRLARLLKRSRK